MADSESRTVNVGRDESDTKNLLSNNSIEPTAITHVGAAKLLHGVEKSYDPGKKLLEENRKNYGNR